MFDQALMTDLFSIFGTLMVLFLPGMVWMIIIRPGKLDPLERIAEAAGASLAWTGLIALILSLLGIRLSAGGVIGIYLAAAGLGTAVAILRQPIPPAKSASWMLLAVGAVLALVAWRLYQARELGLPAWVDSVHHVLLVRKMIEFGGLPPDWLPYLNVPMYYHYGFHILAASFSFWSRLDPAQAVLIFGQVINAMVAFSVYRLAKAAWGDPLRAWLACLLTAFGFHMPAYYLTWGRYPMLAGLMVMPLAMAAALEVRRNPSDRAAWGRLVLFTAATCVSHFLMVGVLGLFFLVLLGAELLRIRWRLGAQSLGSFAWQPFAGAGLGALATVPWLVWVWQNTHAMFSVQLPDPLDPIHASEAAWQYIIYLTGPDRSHILLILAGVGLLLGLAQNRVRLVAVWGLLIGILSTPYGPRFEPFRPDLLTILLFLPGSLLLANLIAWLSEVCSSRIEKIKVFRNLFVSSQNLSDSRGDAPHPVPPSGWYRPYTDPDIPGGPGLLPPDEAIVPSLRRSPFWRMGLALTVGLGISAWGIWETRDLVNPVTVLAQAADLPAIAWVKEYTPADARFFINSTAWQGLYRGEDGGYWLMPLTGRYTVVPPAAYGFGASQDILRQNDFAKRASEIRTCDDSFWALVREDHLNYAYIRSGTGGLQPAGLEGCQGVGPVYEKDGVSIYRLLP